MKWKTENRKVSSLKEWAKNPRSLTEKGLNDLEKSIKKFGIAEPIVINTDGTICGGHGRKKILERLGITEVDCYVPLKKLSDKDFEELNIRLNANIAGVFDWDILANEFDQIELAEWGVEFPFDTTPEAEEDDFQIPEEIVTDIVRGDLFELKSADGKLTHRILCGDSTSETDVKLLMDGQKWDIGFTSPPYNGGGKGLKSKGYSQKKQDKFYTEFSDNLTKEQYEDFLISVLCNYNLHAKEIHSLFWNVNYNNNSRDDYGKILFGNKNPFKVQELIHWDKLHGYASANHHTLSRICEMVFLLSNSEKYLTNQKTQGDVFWNVWRIGTNNSQEHNAKHHACFPVALPTKALTDFSKQGDLVLDLFGGSFTTLISCHQLQRNFVGMEISPSYVQVGVDRILKLDPTLSVKKNGKPYSPNK